MPFLNGINAQGNSFGFGPNEIPLPVSFNDTDKNLTSICVDITPQSAVFISFFDLSNVLNVLADTDLDFDITSTESGSIITDPQELLTSLIETVSLTPASKEHYLLIVLNINSHLQSLPNNQSPIIKYKAVSLANY